MIHVCLMKSVMSNLMKSPLKKSFKNRSLKGNSLDKSHSQNSETQSLNDSPIDILCKKPDTSENRNGEKLKDSIDPLFTDSIQRQSNCESIEDQDLDSRKQETRIESQKTNHEMVGLTKPPSLYSELCQKDVLVKFLKCILIQIGIYSVYGPSLYLNNDLGISNIYLSGSLLSLLGMAGYLLNFLFVAKMGHRTMNIMINLVVLTCCVILLIMDLISNAYIPYQQRSKAVRAVETGFPFSQIYLNTL